MLGADGMTGYAIHKYLAWKGYDVVGLVRRDSIVTKKHTDLRYNTGFDAISINDITGKILNLKPSVVINAILCKDQSDITTFIKVNALFPRILSRALTDSGIWLIHIGSDGIYDGKLGNYNEKSEPHPDDLYGIIKYLAQPSEPLSITINTSLIGLSPRNSGSLLDWALRSENDIQGYTNYIFNPVTTLEFSKFLDEIVFPNIASLERIIHLGSNPISKYELLALTIKAWGRRINVIPVENRPVNRVLDTTYIRESYNYRAPQWEAMIEDLKKFHKEMEL